MQCKSRERDCSYLPGEFSGRGGGRAPRLVQRCNYLPVTGMWELSPHEIRPAQMGTSDLGGEAASPAEPYFRGGRVTLPPETTSTLQRVIFLTLLPPAYSSWGSTSPAMGTTG